MNDREFIKAFSKITIKGLCEREHLNRTYILSKKCKYDNKDVKRLKRCIENEIAKLYLIKEDEK